MSTNNLAQKFYGNAIISVSNGQIIAKVEDILIDPDALQVTALVTAKRGGGLLQREHEVDLILGDKVQVWGQDAVLVTAPDVIVKESETPGSEKWLSVSEQLKGRDVISIDGRRIGQLNDVALDVKGALVEYDLGQVFIEGPIAQSKRIAVETTHALGQDVLIVKMVETVETALPAEPDANSEEGYIIEE
ncbi:MAG: hypothetical protein B6243_06725 [Anaerolineaceae bacterium 4572_5.2]|nr:MAG: hypothetical protein B6243_06725 [Anaerolineaceae bacterium 4572_5.2]